MALSKKYGTPMAELRKHISDLLYRFTNAALKDTCQRVGGDPARKLGPDDRLIGSAGLALEMGVCPACIAVGAAAGVWRYLAETEDGKQSETRAEAALLSVSGLEKGSELFRRILQMYGMLLEGRGLNELIAEADRIKAEQMQNVI